MRLSQRERNAAEGILPVRDIKEKQYRCGGLYVLCSRSSDILLNLPYSISGAGYGLTKGDSFLLLKWEEKVKCVLAIFMLSHTPHKQKIGRSGISRDEEAEIHRNSWHLKWKYKNKILMWTTPIKNAWWLTLFLSTATHLPNLSK